MAPADSARSSRQSPSSPSIPAPHTQSTPKDPNDGELASLVSIFDNVPFNDIIAAFSSANHKLLPAIDILLEQQQAPVNSAQLDINDGDTQPMIPNSLPGLNDSLPNLKDSTRLHSTTDLLLPPNQNTQKETPDHQTKRRKTLIPNALLLLKDSTKSHPATKPTVLTQASLESKVPCKLILDTLPKTLAESLLSTLLTESKTYELLKFGIFDRQVFSKHTSALYIDSESEWAVEEGGYYHAGMEPASRDFLPEMRIARDLVAAQVRDFIQPSPESSIELAVPFNPALAIVNHYPDAESSVGFHSDRLNSIGPRPAIASLTLGAKRVFSIRRTLAPNDIYHIYLPHNSLLIMLPGFQEEFRHSIPACSNKSTPQRNLYAYPSSPSPTSRINLTFRHQRPTYSPDSSPLCTCGHHTDLKPVLNQIPVNGMYKYFYTCAAGGGNSKAPGEKCEFFIWLEEFEMVRRADLERSSWSDR